jgi:hypothetical protein
MSCLQGSISDADKSDHHPIFYSTWKTNESFVNCSENGNRECKKQILKT